MFPVSKDKISKLKYVYRAYQDVVGDFHIEKFPIVYINKMYVYFAIGSSDSLNMIPVNKVNEKFPKSYDIKKSYGNFQYFWFSSYTQEEVNENINNLKEELYIEKIDEQKLNILQKISQLKDEYSKLEKKLRKEMRKNDK